MCLSFYCQKAIFSKKNSVNESFLLMQLRFISTNAQNRDNIWKRLKTSSFKGLSFEFCVWVFFYKEVTSIRVPTNDFMGKSFTL